MTFAQRHGNEDLVKALTGMVDEARVPHAILFHEEDGGGAFPICLAFLQYLYCRNRHEGDSCNECPSCNKIGKLIHPDVHFIFPTAAGTISLQYMESFRTLVGQNPNFTEKELSDALGIEGKNSMIAVSEAKHLLETLSLTALEGGYRSVVIYLPEKMNPDSANRLLKIMEEPPLKTQFLLITHRSENVLQTIYSRCQYVRVRPADNVSLGGVEFDEPEILTQLVDALAAKDLLACLDVAERIAALPSRESAKAFCKFAAERFRLVFLVQQGLQGLGPASDEARIWAGKLPRTFVRNAMGVLDRSMMLIDRNVNLKILFADMADRLFMLI